MPVDAEFEVRSIEDAGLIEEPRRPRVARARVSITSETYDGKDMFRVWRKLTAPIMRLFTTAHVSGHRWWAWTDRPPSLRAIWAMSDLDPARVHKGSPTLTGVWRWMNRTERPVLFLLVVVAPGFVQPLLRWVFVRPTRRAGFWVAVSLIAVFLLVGWLVG